MKEKNDWHLHEARELPLTHALRCKVVAWREAAVIADDLACTQSGAALTMLLSESRIYRRLAEEIEALISGK